MSAGRRARGGVSFLVALPPAPRKVPRGRPLDALLLAAGLWVLILLAIHAMTRGTP